MNPCVEFRQVKSEIDVWDYSVGREIKIPFLKLQQRIKDDIGNFGQWEFVPIVEKNQE